MCVYISESLEEAEGMRQDGHGADGVLWFRGDGRQEHGWFPIISRAIPQVALYGRPQGRVDFHKQVLSEELFIFYVSKKEWCIHNIPCHLHFTLVK